ncbi:MAG: sensor histidine kinase, partial [Treponema sp.]|nr:sensor histidine kinase [Treponema sp.]
KALQAQINPHFLYNTLDLINWMALRSGIPSISGLVQSLAMFYKLSLGSGNDMAPLREEIAHVKVYLEIQAVRFDNKIQYSFSIDDAITECPVPKIILQPLVENSIIHGILEKPDKTGTILVSGQRNNNNIILSVTDDGVGMDSGITETIVTKGTDRYGVFNIDQRIKLYYGDQYGLSYRSAPAQGTTATITLPYPN